MLALLLAAAVGAAEPDIYEWGSQTLTGTEGWSFLGGGSETLLFAQQGPSSAPSRRRIWLRYEMRSDKRSTVELLEIECAEVKAKTLQVTTYSQNSMRGETSSREGVSTQYALPGTLLEVAIKWACKPKAP